MTGDTILLAIIAALLAAVGFFIVKILEKTDKIGDDVADMKPKIKVLWEMQFATSNSPLIKQIIDSKLEQLLDELKNKKPENAYQIQECARKVMQILKNDSEILSKLQVGAYNTGVDVDTVLFTGSLYLRDLALPKFNCKLEDVDDKKAIPGSV